MLLQRKRDLVEFSQLLLTIMSLSVNFDIWKMLREFRGTENPKSTHSESAASCLRVSGPPLAELQAS